MSKIAFIGGGNMATSLIGGLVDSGYAAADIVACDPLPDQLARLRQRFDVKTTPDNDVAVGGAETVVLAVKPQIMREVVLGIAAATKAGDPLVVSIAAGVKEPSLRAWLGYDAPIVRCMPNTPALLGCGATGLYANAQVSKAQRETAQTILGAAGITLWVEDEGLIDAVTAVSGSGPAYFFMLMEHIIEVGVELGLSRDASARLTLQTALGAARMALEGADDPATLRAKVTSPGGTTERALELFEQAGIRDIVRTALTGARDRSRELAKSS